MDIIYARNVNDAYAEGTARILKHGQSEPSRDGPVFVMPHPVVTVYNRPWERVLMDPVRDANPFFHLMESVWMLAGRRDPQWLDRYIRKFSERFAEEGGEMHGAYGYRWRRHFNREGSTYNQLDQFAEVAEMLRRDPTTRRAVLTMWDPVIDCNLPSRDLPCNTHVYFRALRECDSVEFRNVDHALDITVCCRSNDAVMGAYGANAVHMSIMGEVIAGLAGMRLGTYRQVSNNFHMYERDLAKVSVTKSSGIGNEYYKEQIVAQPICGESDDPSSLEIGAKLVLSDSRCLCEALDGGEPLDMALAQHAKSDWFRDTVIPMQRAHDAYRRGDHAGAIELLARMPERSDWSAAGIAWIERRMK